MDFVKVVISAFVFVCVASLVQAQTVGSLFNDVQKKNAAVLLFEQDTDLKQALHMLEGHFNIVFLYRSETIANKKLKQTAVPGLNVKKALNVLLENTGLHYKYLNPKTYGIFSEISKPEKIPFDHLINETITGRVTDAETGEALPGVNILVEGTADVGTTTNIDGEYELQVPGLDITLVFSYIGYETQRIPVDGRNSINIQMTFEPLEGEELIVTAFGVTREIRSLTYSAQSVDTESIGITGSFNTVNALQGKVAGLTITKGSRGLSGDSRVILRGERSFAGRSEPLYIVDGVPSSMQDISPNDIVSIDVMKGPNAAALYGSQAQNGAIIITTRQAQKGEVNFNVSSTFTLETPVNHINFQNEYGQGINGNYSPSVYRSWGPRMEGQMVDHWSPTEELAGTQYAFLPQPNNVDDLFQTGYSSGTTISAGLGGENTQSQFSYTFTDGADIIPGHKLQRHNINMRITSQINDRLTLDSRLSYMTQNIDNEYGFGGQPDNVYRNLYQLPRNIRTEDISRFEYMSPDGTMLQHFWNYNDQEAANPYWNLERILNERSTNRLSTFASLTYNISERMSLMVRGNMNMGSGGYEQKWYNDTYRLALNGYYSKSSNEFRTLSSDFLLSYDRQLTNDFGMDINFGGNITSSRNSSLSAHTGLATNSDLILPNLFSLSNTQEVFASSSIGSPSEMQSLYSFAQLRWRDTIYLDVTGRNDWSSTLPSHNRSYFYPSVGISAIVNDLFSLPDMLSLVKLRASWAQVGNTAPPFQLDRTASVGPGGRQGFLFISNTLPAQDLKPEQTESIELGADIRFFDGRLGLDATVYRSNTINQLVSISLPVGSGAGQGFVNAGNVQNQGIELLLSGKPVQTHNLLWDIHVNFTKNESLVKEVHSDLSSLERLRSSIISFRIEEGQPFGQIYGLGFVRNDNGDVIVGANGIPNITPEMIPLADYNPDFIMGFSNTIHYKNLSLSFLIDHRQGGTLVSYTNAFLDHAGVTKRTLQGREEPLVFGENFFSHETAVTALNQPNTREVSAEAFWTRMGGRSDNVAEAFVEDATNTRLRELTLGYSLPQSLIANLPVTDLTISLVGRNLFFFYNAAEGMDPEMMASTSMGYQGLHTMGPPTTRSFGMNIKANF